MKKKRLHFSRGNSGLEIKSGTGIGLFAGRSGFVEARSSLCVRTGCDWNIRQLTPSAVEFQLRIQNRRADALRLKEICVFEGSLRAEGAGWQVGHCELFKTERYLDGFGAYTGGFFRAFDNCEGDFGLSEDMPFPGIFFTHPERGTLLLATLSQDRCKPCWQIRSEGRGRSIRILDWFSGIPAIPLAGETEYVGEHHAAIFSSAGIEEALDQYYAMLRKRISFPGAASVLRNAVLWGTWNYNPWPRGHWDVTHDYVKSNARAMRRMFPNRPRFVMIDDGYQRGRSAEPTEGDWFCSAFESFFPEGAPEHDGKLFPKGMRAIAKDIRKMGCEPAIWVTPRLHRKSQLARAHPDWLLHLTGEEHFGPRSAYLDYSIPEVRDFTRSVWEKIICRWGFKGIKLDFWTLPFEIPQVRYRHRDRTAIELRNQFLQDLRELIPSDGYILTAVVTSRGNPFPGRFLDASRHSYDIGTGKWGELCEAGRCLGASANMFRHDCLLADSDSIGWQITSTPGENRLGATIALLSGAVCEIGGDLATASREAREFLQRGVGFHGPVLKTRVLREGAGWGGLPDRVQLVREDGMFEGRLNWTGYPLEIVLPDKVRDLWSGNELKGKISVPPHDAILFATKD